MTLYVAEEFSEAESDVLRRYFTNLDGPVFALVNLPEVVKGALFARYSRSPKSLRRLFLDEFVGELDVSGDVGIDATVGLARAEELYEKVFVEYGDDSVAQLGGVHLACEQASNLLTKVLEWGRLMSYLEQSTRVTAYDSRLGGRYRYHRDPQLVGSRFGARYVGEIDRMFESYTAITKQVTDHLRTTGDRPAGVSDIAHRHATQARAFDATRGLLPAAALSNVGMYGSGQAFESLLIRLRSHPLPEARSYGALMLDELRKVIPSFVQRVDQPELGGKWSRYLADTRRNTAAVVDELFESERPGPVPPVTLVDFDPAAEDKLLAAICYPFTDLSETQVAARIAALGTDERVAILRSYVGERTDRRHKPGRAFERSGYRFDVLSDYGSFRDLQRHRMMTIDWQPLNTAHGFDRPALVDDAGATERFDETMQRSADLFATLGDEFPDQAPYAVAMAYRVRYVMQFNARQAIHVLELRSGPQAHPAYRQIAVEMHRLIGEQAGHRAIAATMRHIADTAVATPAEAVTVAAEEFVDDRAIEAERL